MNNEKKSLKEFVAQQIKEERQEQLKGGTIIIGDVTSV